MEVKLVKRGKSSFQRREGKVSKHKTNKVKFVCVAPLTTTVLWERGFYVLMKQNQFLWKQKEGTTPFLVAQGKEK